MHDSFELPVCEMLDEIAARGAVIVATHLPGTRLGWAHTVGLVARHHHPELLAGSNLVEARRVLTHLIDQVAVGERWCDDDVVEVDGRLMGLRDPGPGPIERGWFDAWFAVHAGDPALRLEVLEVGPAEDVFAP